MIVSDGSLKIVSEKPHKSYWHLSLRVERFELKGLILEAPTKTAQIVPTVLPVEGDTMIPLGKTHGREQPHHQEKGIKEGESHEEAKSSYMNAPDVCPLPCMQDPAP